MKKSAWILLKSKEKFLILRRSKESNNPGLWNFPGGTVEPSEQPITTAYKELFEEVGVKSIRLTEVNLIRNELGEFYYFVGIFKGKLKLNQESDAFKWVTYDDLKRYQLHKSIKTYYNTDNLPGISVVYNHVGGGVENITISDVIHPSNFVTVLYTGNSLKVNAVGGSNLNIVFKYMVYLMKFHKISNLYILNSVLPNKKQQFLSKWKAFCKKKQLNRNFNVKET
jgi:ADP-ribose pyrophosphatase YjhB (NUDIX family)